MPISYDSSREALLQPGLRPTVFRVGDAGNLTIDAVCAECSRLAYIRFESSNAERDRLLDAVGRIGGTDFLDFNDAETGTQGFAVLVPFAGQTSRRRALVAFRGTEPDRMSDLAVDLRASTVVGPHERGAVHKGFMQSFRGVEKVIEAWLLSRASETPVFTGHSLGAALATLAAAQWPGAQLVTFGSPRVGDEVFRTTVSGEVARYLNCCDIVCRVPPETALYTHVGGSIYIDRNNDVQEVVSVEAMSSDRAAARIHYLKEFAWRVGSVLVRDLADHAPINYVRALIRDR